MISRLTLAGPRRGRLALALAAGLGMALALSPGQLAPATLRAAAAATALGAAALLAAGGVRRPAAARRLSVVSHQSLSRESGVALLQVDDRAVLVGFGSAGVRLLQADPPGPATSRAPGPAQPEARP